VAGLKTVFVGNLHFQVTHEHLIEAFSAYGAVRHARVVFDRDTGQSKRFGFVEMVETSAAEAAIGGLQGAQWFGRTLRVGWANGDRRQMIG
jgi:RNA recognition motif-containing protein